MDEFRARYPVIISMLMQHTSDGEILELMGITNEQWLEIQQDSLFIEMMEAARENREGPMSPDEVIERATGLTGEAFESLEAVLSDPRAGASARLKASEMIFNWRTELLRRKSEAESRIVYNLVIDSRSVRRMEDMMDMLAGDEGRAWLQEVSQVMPNSTA